MNRPSNPHRSADPVRRLLHQHRELCERAVDPLEIAAVLETHGITDRTAARFRHRDVFSLAEELYARAPRPAAAPAAQPPPSPPPAPSPPPSPVSADSDGPPRRRPGRAARAARTVLLPLLPGGLCAATLCAAALTGSLPQPARLAVGVVGAVLVLASVRMCLRGTALNGAAPTGAAVLAGCWLVGYALAGDGLLTRALDGGPWTAVSLAERCVPLGLALAVAPAVWCARWFALRGRRRLGTSRSLREFAAGTRPLLAAAVALFAAALLAVLTAAHLAVDGGAAGGAVGGTVGGATGGGHGLEGVPVAAVAALGTLLFTAVLLTAHGFPSAAAGGLVAACALEATALTTVLAASRWPALAPLGRPVEEAVAAWGPAAVPAAACACAALVLLVLAAGSLTGASAHHRDGP